MNIISKLWAMLNIKERKTFVALIITSFINSIFETIGIGLVLPFVALIINPSILQKNKILVDIHHVVPNFDQTEFVIFLTGLLIICFVGKNLFSFGFQVVQSRFVFNYGVDIGSRLFRNYLYSPYLFHVKHNSIELLDIVQTEVGNFVNTFLLHFFICMTEGVTVLAYLAFLLWFDPFATLLIFSVLGLCTSIFYLMLKKKLVSYSHLHREASNHILRHLTHGLGGIKEVKLLHKEHYFLQEYIDQAKKCAKYNGFINSMSCSPRYFIEVVTTAVVLGVMIMLMVTGTSPQAVLLKLSILGVASMRLLPSANRLIGSMVQVRYASHTLNSLHRDIVEFPKVDFLDHNTGKELAFKTNIELADLSFQYPDSKQYALDSINLTIKKGQSVAFVGQSGAGKTTIVDIILGLLAPSNGQILVDGNNIFDNIGGWQKKLGYIPQTIYLADDTIRANVAFGIAKEEVDDAMVWHALRMAQLENVIKELPEGIDTVIGERGTRLSGGQRQRLGIARALYHNPEILVMDEATSALDHQTEQEVVAAIDALAGEKTIIIIAHRFSTIRRCDMIFFMEKGHLIDQGNYEQLLASNEKFRNLAGHTLQ
ncbi:MAG: transporter ATP-binding protein [Gammaproteobacteria bacterium]|nr:transporter ATP-binding protein [Gammaproteobacteria bacterium]